MKFCYVNVPDLWLNRFHDETLLRELKFEFKFKFKFSFKKKLENKEENEKLIIYINILRYARLLHVLLI